MAKTTLILQVDYYFCSLINCRINNIYLIGTLYTLSGNNGLIKTFFSLIRVFSFQDRDRVTTTT